MDPSKPQDNAAEPVATPKSIYPTPTKGPVSDDHSGYQKPVKWAGKDPDSHNKLYFIGFIIVLIILFALAVQSWTGVNILKRP